MLRRVQIVTGEGKVKDLLVTEFVLNLRGLGMTLIADVLLIAGALAAAFYCWILSARVKSLKDLDAGLGAAIAALSSKVDDMQSALRATQKAHGDTQTDIQDMTTRAQKAAESLSDMLERVEAAERRDERRARQERVRVAKEAAAAKEAEENADPVDDVAPLRVLKSQEEQAPEEVADAIDNAETPAVDAQEELPPAVSSVVQRLNQRAAPAVLTNAEKLQREIRSRLADRDQPNSSDSEDVVKTIQSLLVAARQ